MKNKAGSRPGHPGPASPKSQRPKKPHELKPDLIDQLNSGLTDQLDFDLIDQLNSGLTDQPTSNPTDQPNSDPTSPPTVIQTDQDSTSGRIECIYCGGTDFFLNEADGQLYCSYCRNKKSDRKFTGLVEDLTTLTGIIIGSGASKIEADKAQTITCKCHSCGAEVVINANEASQARCHWCRNTFSINHQVPNGSIPDATLPFSITREEARQRIREFVGRRKFFAHPKFRREFTTENIMGVYFPYMIIDANTSVSLSGQGEHLIRSYSSNSDNNDTYYDADLYDLSRDFDLTISGLTIESSSQRLARSENRTDNIINAIMPFDIENCVHYNADHLKGYTSERRDTEVETLRPLAENQIKNLARYSANQTIDFYDRGVRWDQQSIKIKGQQWKSAYLPVWLYSYQQVTKDKKILHYVAVNARTKETIGSIPINIPKLAIISFLIETFGIGAFITFDDFEYNWLPLTFGFVFFGAVFAFYRNQNARHTYEKETKTHLFNLRKSDRFIKRLNRLKSSTMENSNNYDLDPYPEQKSTEKADQQTEKPKE